MADKNGRVTTRQLYEALLGVGDRVDGTNARIDGTSARIDNVNSTINELRDVTNSRLHDFERRLNDVEGTALPVRLLTRGGRYSAAFGVLAVSALLVENILMQFGWPWPF